ncbi:MAG: hypothetical protein RLZZ215_2583 [Pseudomonadota bacterium]|jgi:predicted RNA-binding Zn ribbon-like protein
MHRTQIYLDDQLHQTLFTQAKLQEISMSELIRRLLTKQLTQKEERTTAVETFFQQLKPLASFSTLEPEQWVRDLRSTSRILS